jgi:mRNA interferase YafQ
MLTPKRSNKFKQDVELAKKRHCPMDKLQTILNILKNEIPIPESYNDHPLKGKWAGYRDLHLQPDWVLIYKVKDGCLFLARTGRHVDIFDNY